MGEDATFTCTSDLVNRTIQWEFNGVPVVADTGDMVQLTFNPVNDSIHEGLFICRAITVAGGNFTDSVIVMVQGKNRFQCMDTGISGLYLICFLSSSSPTVPVPAFNLTTEVSGVPTAGQTYSLTCNVTEIIDGLTGSPAVEWLSSPVAVMDLGADVSGTSASQRITFNPLLTSHGREYTCRATLDSPAVEGGNITATDTQTVIVESKLLNCIYLQDFSIW